MPHIATSMTVVLFKNAVKVFKSLTAPHQVARVGGSHELKCLSALPVVAFASCYIKQIPFNI